jgi:hypothetical protein
VACLRSLYSGGVGEIPHFFRFFELLGPSFSTSVFVNFWRIRTALEGDTRLCQQLDAWCMPCLTIAQARCSLNVGLVGWFAWYSSVAGWCQEPAALVPCLRCKLRYQTNLSLVQTLLPSLWCKKWKSGVLTRLSVIRVSITKLSMNKIPIESPRPTRTWSYLMLNLILPLKATN